MAETNDYEKAKQECRDKCFEKFLKTAGWTKEQVAEEVNLTFNYIFDIVFKRAYQLGKDHAENKGIEWQARNDGSFTSSFIQHFDGESTVIPNRTIIAAMAMQGILSNAATTAAITMSLQTEALKKGITVNTEELSDLSIETAAAMSAKYADALLSKLNNNNNEKEN